MVNFNEIHYRDLAQEVSNQMIDLAQMDGVVELEFQDFQVVMWWQGEMKATRKSEIVLKRWLVLTFEEGARCGNDFDIIFFMKHYDKR